MNNTVKILTLVSIFSLFLFGSGALTQGGSSAFAEDFQEGIVGGGYHSTGWDTFEASWLIGREVHSPLGGDLGQIEDVMIDRSDGHVVLVILSGVPGFGGDFVAAPFSALERTGEETFQLNFDYVIDSMPSTPYPYESSYANQLSEYRSIVGLSTVPSSIDALWADFVYQFYGQTPYWTEGKTPHPDIMSYRTAGPSMGKTAPILMGATVQSNEGKAEARINDLVIDPKDGRVAFLVLDKVQGRADSQVAVPFNELSMSGNAFVLNTTQNQLASAPSFDEVADMNSLGYAENVYRYFGQRPYWTEEGTR